MGSAILRIGNELKGVSLVRRVLSSTLVWAGFVLLLMPGTAWLIFWSYFYLGLVLDGLGASQPWHSNAVVAAPTLALCWFGVLSLWRLFLYFIYAWVPPRWPSVLAMVAAFTGAVQLALAFPIMATLMPLTVAGLVLGVHWGWLQIRGFDLSRAPEAG